MCELVEAAFNNGRTTNNFLLIVSKIIVDGDCGPLIFLILTDKQV